MRDENNKQLNALNPFQMVTHSNSNEVNIPIIE